MHLGNVEVEAFQSLERQGAPVGLGHAQAGNAVRPFKLLLRQVLRHAAGLRNLAHAYTGGEVNS